MLRKRLEGIVFNLKGRWASEVHSPKTKPPPCFPSRRLGVLTWHEKRWQRDGCFCGAGDGTRTRDSLLGRQMVAGSPFACYEMALGERSYIFTVTHAHLRQMVARNLRQMVMDQMHWKEYTRQLLERQERQMVNHPGTQHSPSPCSLKCPEQLSHDNGKITRARGRRYLRWRRAGSVRAV